MQYNWRMLYNFAIISLNFKIPSSVDTPLGIQKKLCTIFPYYIYYLGLVSKICWSYSISSYQSLIRQHNYRFQKNILIFSKHHLNHWYFLLLYLSNLNIIRFYDVIKFDDGLSELRLFLQNTPHPPFIHHRSIHIHSLGFGWRYSLSFHFFECLFLISIFSIDIFIIFHYIISEII